MNSPENESWGPPSISNDSPMPLLSALGIVAILFGLIPLTQIISISAAPPLHVLDTDVMRPPPPELPEPPPPVEDEPEDLEIDDLEQEVNLPDLTDLDVLLHTDMQTKFRGIAKIPEIVVDEEYFDTLWNLEDLEEPPRPITRVAPLYPDRERRNSVKGRVVVVFVVNRQGRVVDPRIEQSSNSSFDGPALNAIKRWRFTPGIKDGRKVRTRMRQPFSFSIH